MGLKSGSRDAGLDENDETDNQSTDEETFEADENARSERTTETAAEEVEPEPSTSEATATAQPIQESETTESVATSQRPAMNAIPYKLRREKVNEGREQVPYFLREDVIEAEDELQDTLETILGEDVYKSDYREAAMVVAQRNPELIAEVLREWGYDLDER
ncbi:hypothetical protein [Halorarum halophilum]|nr:hypothetical protein [Halobaculum halophilum]